MKKNISILLALLAIATMFACNSKTTELAFKNSSNSTDKINNIIFQASDGTPISKWSSDNGYALGDQTASNEISKTTGTISCAMWDGADYAACTVVVEDNNSSSLDLSEGESYVYTLKAQ